MNDISPSTQGKSAWDIVWTLSQEGTITSANAAVEKLTGWASSAWEGQSLMALVHPDDMPVIARHLRDVLDGQLLPPFELRIRSRSGPAVLAEASITRLQNGHAPGRLAVVARDITARHRAEEVLRQGGPFSGAGGRDARRAV
jgi:PAS domain S-box-containing protein